jgi:aspartate-semialdehyde dehydrogenase
LRKFNVVVVGATGVVGSVFLRILIERGFPLDQLRLCASPNSVGKRLLVGGAEIQVEATTPSVFEGADFAFISVSAEISRQLVPLASRAGALVIDDSAAFRLDSDVPLVVPEINGADLDKHKGITAIPNCSTTQMVMALYPLHRANPIRRIIVDSYQSVSGTGGGAIAELQSQSQAVLNGQEVINSIYPHQIAFNIFPHIEPFMEDGYTREEFKMREETRKILHAPDMAISATCVRVPVSVSHSEAIHVEFDQPMSPDEARDLLAAFPGVSVVDEPASNSYPTPLQAEGRDEVLVGRIRRDTSNPNGLAMWVVGDNLRKGAALNAIQIAEEAVSRGLTR